MTLPIADYRDFESTSISEQDKKLMVRFFPKEREIKSESAKAGRPIYKDVDYVEIRAPGRRDALACRPATETDKRRFPEHYERYQKRMAEPETGTPLKEWPRVSRSQVEELAFFHVKTVEQLVSMADADAMKLHGGLNLKHEAAQWLEASEESALIAEKEALQNRVHDLEEKLNKLLAAEDAKVATVEAKTGETAAKTKVKPRPRK